MDQRTIDELELSIDFGKKLVEYKKECLHKMLETMSDNDKIRQHYEHDRAYICDVIKALEIDEGIAHMYPIKNRLTIIGQMYFKKEFKALKDLCSRNSS